MTLQLTETGWRHRIEVLDHGIVQLEDWMGHDLRVVNAAQSSFDRESSDFETREGRILNSLIRDEHGVPFEHVKFTFKLRLPLFLARQYVKHRHGSWSEHSGRYSTLSDLYYVPKIEDVRSQIGKPMDYKYERASEGAATQFIQALDQASANALASYSVAMKNGIAKEQARFFLPENRYTTAMWSLNLRSLFNVIRLRADRHAQWEAQQYAEAMGILAAKVVPETMRLWEEHGRPKP